MRTARSKEQYGFIDIMKFLLSLLIVAAHFISENAAGRINRVIDYASSFYVIVVPFFFVCSGFLLFRKLNGGEDDWGKVKAYCKKILILYAGWSFVYVLFKIATWLRFGVTAGEVFHYLLNAVTYSTYKTIWFLPATVIGVLLTYWFNKRLGRRATCLVAGAFYLIGCLGTSYCFLVQDTAPLNRILEIYNYIFSSSRNGFFNGFPFVVIGLLIAGSEPEKFKAQRNRNFLFTALFAAAFVTEAFVIKIRFHAVNANTLLFLIPFSYFFVMWCLGVSVRAGKTTLWLRKMSTDIFLCQRVYLSALPGVLPGSVFGTMLTGNPYIGLSAVLFLTIVTAAALIALSGRNRWFSQFC